MRWRNVSLAALPLVVLLAACGTPEPTATPRVTTPDVATPTPGAAATPDAMPAPTPSDGDAPSDAPTPTPGLAGFEAEWEALIAAAKEEGRMVPVIGGGNGHEMQAIYDHFAELFDIRMIYSRGSSREQADRIFAEQGAGRYLVDTVHSGATTMTTRYVPNGALQLFDPWLFHPEVTDKSLWLQGKHWYEDVQNGFSFVFSGTFAEEDAAPGVTFNTNLVSIEEATAWRSMFDVLEYAKANWPGMVVAGNPLQAGGGFSGNLPRDYLNPALGPEWIEAFYGDPSLDLFFTDDEETRCNGLALGKFAMGMVIGGFSGNLPRDYLNPALGPDWIEAFYGDPSLDLFFTDDEETRCNGLALGKFAMGMVIGGCDDHIRAGAPMIRVDTAFRTEHNIPPYAELPDVVGCIACAVGTFVNTPNPNVTKLFVNWLLSREGQTVYHEKVGLGTAAGREEEGHGQHTFRVDDIPLGNVDPLLVPDRSKTYLGLEMQPVYFEILTPVTDWVKVVANSAYFDKTGVLPPRPYDAAELRRQTGLE
jgi:ABC-type Fe3+ transport system substrate-binding protein